MGAFVSFTGKRLGQHRYESCEPPASVMVSLIRMGVLLRKCVFPWRASSAE
eukprot:gene2571-15826_t